MSLLPTMILYLAVGCGEWYLALRRTLACARGERVLLVVIVFIENLLGLWVLSNFIRTNNWFLALSYSAGAAAGALIVAMKTPQASPSAPTPSLPDPPRPLAQEAEGPVCDRDPLVSCEVSACGQLSTPVC